MLATGWLWVDPVVSLIVAGVILVSTWGLLRDSVNLAMAGVPYGIELGAVERFLRDQPEVTGVHDLHVWALSTTEPALTAHLQVETQRDGDALIRRVERELHDRFGIEHTTIQLETEAGCHGCAIEPEPYAQHA
jgi:cobalt-zinc-cadmium efflux system protein